MTKRQASLRLAFSTPEARQGQAERGRKGGRVSAAKARARARAKYAAMGLPVAVAMQLRDEAYGAGWRRGKRVGFSDGYEQALQDMKRARVA